MSTQSVFCLASSHNQANRIIAQLRLMDYSNIDISALFPGKETTRDFAHEKNSKGPEGARAGVGTGGVLGGALGWIAGIGASTIPGIGPFFAAGPIVAAISGAAIGAALGGVAGGLVGMGIPESEAKRYEGKVKAGNILISAHAKDVAAIHWAKEIFTRAAAEDICVIAEASPPRETKASKYIASPAHTGYARTQP